MNVFQMVVSTFHVKMKFPVADNVGEVRGEQFSARRCYYEALRLQGRVDNINETTTSGKRPGDTTAGQKEEKRPKQDPEEKAEPYIRPMEDLVLVEIVPGKQGHTTKIGNQMEKKKEEELVKFMCDNHDVFAWSPTDIKGINPKVIVHKLNVRPNARPIKQRKRHFGAEKDQIIEEEVQKLLTTGHIKEVQYPSWLSNEC